MTDQEHKGAIHAAAKALNDAIEAARKDKIFTKVMTMDVDHFADWQPTSSVIVSVVKAI